MKIKKPVAKKLLRTLESARELIDSACPTSGGGGRMRKLENAYDAILSVEEVFRDGLRKRGPKGSLQEVGNDVHGLVLAQPSAVAWKRRKLD